MLPLQGAWVWSLDWEPRPHPHASEHGNKKTNSSSSGQRRAALVLYHSDMTRFKSVSSHHILPAISWILKKSGREGERAWGIHKEEICIDKEQCTVTQTSSGISDGAERDYDRRRMHLSPTLLVGVNWCSHHGKQRGGSSKTSKQSCHMTQQCHLHIPRQNYNLKRYTYPYIHRSTVTTAKTWKPKCPLTDEWIKKMWYI